MTGDSLAETTAEDHGQTAIQTPQESLTAPAETASSVGAAQPATPADAASHADTNGSPGPVVESLAAPQPAAEVDTPAAAPEAEAQLDADAPEPEVPVVAEPPRDVAEPVTEAPSADEPTAAVTAAPAIAPDAEKPAVGPRILGIAEPVKPLPTVKAAAPARKRRRRPSAPERHRRAFFSALTDLRRGTAVPADAAAADPQAEDAATAEVVEPAVEAPVASEPAVVAVAAETPSGELAAADAAKAEGERQPIAAAVDDSPSSPALVTAAIERVGGPEAIKEALKPKQDEKGQPLKWAAVCAQSAEGLKPGDPIFNAWVRLAATPVREVKSQLPRPPEQERGGRPGEAGGRRPGGPRPGGDRGGRPRRDDRPSRQELASHAQDGTLRKSIRIVTGHDEDQERRERERIRKEQREAKRRAERERLARLGY
ncbi:MAG: hypothetical protein WKF42_03690 [Solirubrobacteraceae bacterium]